MKQFIRQFNMLQNNLGDFNDLSVQQQVVAKYLSTIKTGTRTLLKLTVSIGGQPCNATSVDQGAF